MKMWHSDSSFKDTERGHAPVLLGDPTTLGAAEVDRRLRAVPWLADFIAHQWAPINTYDDGYSAVARLIAISVAIDSTNPESLAYASGIPVLYVRLVLDALCQCKHTKDLLHFLRRAAIGPVDVLAIKYRLDEFMMGEFDLNDYWPGIYDVLELDIRGVGRAPFDASPSITAEDQRRWPESFPFKE